MEKAKPENTEAGNDKEALVKGYEELFQLTGHGIYSNIAERIKNDNKNYVKDDDILISYLTLYRLKEEKAYLDVIKHLTSSALDNPESDIIIGQSSLNAGSLKANLRGSEPKLNEYRKGFKIDCAHHYSHEIHQVLIPERNEYFDDTRNKYVDHIDNFEMSYMWENRSMHAVIDNDFITSYITKSFKARDLTKYSRTNYNEKVRKYYKCDPQEYLMKQHKIRLMKQIQACVKSGALNEGRIFDFYVNLTLLFHMSSSTHELAKLDSEDYKIIKKIFNIDLTEPRWTAKINSP